MLLTFLVSTTTSGMVCRMVVNSLSASVNLPSVVVLYATLSFSSSCGSLNASDGAPGVPDADCAKSRKRGQRDDTSAF